MTEPGETPERLIASVLDSAPSMAAPEDHGLALVAREGGFGDRYRVWRGRSGRRYLVTVMPLGEALRAENGIILLVAIDPDGGRRIVWAGETGATLPGLELSPHVRLEAHVHLIAASPAKRAAALDDLISGTQSYSSVLTVNAAASQARVGSTTPRRSSSRAVFST
jgi:hypothetical protein